VGSVIAFLITNYMITPMYTSTMDTFVNNYIKSDGTEQVPSITGSNIQAAINMVKSYSVMLNNEAFIKAISDDIGNELSASKLKGTIKVASVNDTDIMRISATTPDPQLSARVCESVAKIAPDWLKDITETGNVRPYGQASIAASPSSPNVTRNLLLGALLGLILPAAMVIFFSLLDTTVKTEDEIKESYSLPTLGAVPSVKVDNELVKRAKGRRTAAIYNATRIGEKTPFAITEAYKTIRTNLVFSLGTYDKKVIEITSSTPEEFKSTTTANLAITISQTGAKTLLIDADMRKPVQHKIFKLDNARGLSSVLVGINELSESVKQSAMPNLDVLTSGPTPPNPSELLGSKNMEILLEALAKYYDYVIIDTPPVNVVTDSLILSKYTTGLLMTVRQNFTKHENLSSAVSAIETANANLLGVVMVDTHLTSRGYKYKGYKYYRSNTTVDDETE